MATVTHRDYRIVGTTDGGWTTYDPKGRYWMFCPMLVTAFNHIDDYLDHEDDR